MYEWHRHKIEDRESRIEARGSMIGNDDSSRWRFIVRVYRGIIRGGRTVCGGSFDESSFTWMHKGNSRHSKGWRTFAQNYIWLDYLLTLGRTSRRNFSCPTKDGIMNPHEPDRSLKGSRSEATVDRCQWFEVAISVGTYKNRLPNDLYARIDSSLRGRLDWSTIFEQYSPGMLNDVFNSAPLDSVFI